MDISPCLSPFNLPSFFFYKALIFTRNYTFTFINFIMVLWKYKDGHLVCYCFDLAYGSWRLSLFQLKLLAIDYVIKSQRSAFLLLSREFALFHFWGWNPPFWYAVFRGVLGRTQYAKGQYAVRNNSVKSYAAFKNSHFLNRFP